MAQGNQTLFQKVYTVLSCLGFFLLLFFLKNRELFADIEALAAKHTLVASLFLLSLYIFRAFLPFIPSLVLYTMSGRLFPDRTLPFLISMEGTLILLTLSYLWGFKHKRKSRFSFLSKYYDLQKDFYDRTEKALGDGKLRTILVFALSPFPIKALGRICGRAHLPFVRYLLATTLGSFPTVFSATLLGKSLSDPESPLFYFSLVLTVVVSVLSLILYQKSYYKENYDHEKSH